MEDNGASSYHRFLKGDREGLVRIVEDYYDDLVRYLTRYLGSEDDAEDMAEEALLVLMNRKPAFRGDATFKTWLFSVAKNVTLKYLYKNNRTIPTAPEDLTNAAIEGDDALERCVREEKSEAVSRAMSRLPEKFRLVLQLKYLENMPVKEIAAATGRTVHGVNSMLKRSRKALKEELQKEGIHDEKS